MEVRSYRGKIVTVAKKSRARFPLAVGIPGDQGLVISTWYSSMGTPKISILLQDGSVRCSTLSCVLVDEEQPSSDKEKVKWEEVKKEYDDQNSIPVIAVCLNVGKKAYRLKSLNNRVFFHRHGGNPEHKKGECFTIKVPIWLAKKEGIIPG